MNKLKKYIDTNSATDMLPSLSIGWLRADMKNIEREKHIASRYGLDYTSMKRWKWAYLILSLASIFALSDFMYFRLPVFITAFAITIWLILLVFFLPKQFVYRFSKKRKNI